MQQRVKVSSKRSYEQQHAQSFTQLPYCELPVAACLQGLVTDPKRPLLDTLETQNIPLWVLGGILW